MSGRDRVHLLDVLDVPAPAIIEPGDVDETGAIEAAVRRDIAGLALTSPIADSLTELAYSLARRIDNGADERVARELRMTLLSLEREGHPVDPDLDPDRLSAPVRDTAHT